MRPIRVLASQRVAASDVVADDNSRQQVFSEPLPEHIVKAFSGLLHVVLLNVNAVNAGKSNKSVLLVPAPLQLTAENLGQEVAVSAGRFKVCAVYLASVLWDKVEHIPDDSFRRVDLGKVLDALSALDKSFFLIGWHRLASCKTGTPSRQSHCLSVSRSVYRNFCCSLFLGKMANPTGLGALV